MTTIKVEYGKAVLFELDSPEFGVLDTNLLGVGEELVDVTDRVVSLSVRRGRQDVLEPVRSGQASVTLRNRDGAFDPLNTASPFYPGVEPARTLAIYADSVQVFEGLVEDIELDFTLDGDATVQISASDTLSKLALAELPAAGLAVSEEDSGARIVDVLDSNANYWTAGTSIATGDSTLAAGTAEGNVLAYLNTVAQSEAGTLFVGRDGDLIFRNRLFAVTATPITLSDDGADLPYEAITRQTSGESLRTVAVAERDGTRIERDSTLGLLRFGSRAVDLGELLLRTDSEVEDRLDFELILRSKPNPTVRSVVVSQLKQANSGVLGLELGDPVIVEFTPPGVSQVSESGVVLNIAHNFTVGSGWRTSIGLQPAQLDGFMILDSGNLDVDALAF
jgi:hypothetical protein